MSQPEDRFVDANGIRMHYLDWGGDGPVGVMVHGAGMCGGLWEPVARRLEGNLRCLTLDLRSHGDSEVSSAPVSWDLLAADIAGFVAALDLRNVVLVAHSFGAGAALLASPRMAGRIAGGYFIEPTLLAQLTRTPEERERGKLARQGVRNKRWVWASRQAMFDSLKGRGGFRLLTDESMWAYVNWGARERPDGSVELKCTPAAEAAFFDAQAEADQVWPILAQVDYPVTLVYSESRRSDPQAWAQHEPIVRRFMELVPTRFAVTPGTHNTAMEHPDIHARLVLELVAQLEQEGRLPGRKAYEAPRRPGT
ncbi:MAG: alpha/beta hydrolase [Chloroflexi bacterium]|nr:alpha/beta hydrolase [Chloroflexota bacterium]